MCTALSFKTKDHYFGRNLDLDISYNEEVCIMPRNYKMTFRLEKEIVNHYAIIGMATIINYVPLFYDATNEFGLSIAGLNFPKNAFYNNKTNGKNNICQFEFIPWILGQCKTIKEVIKLLKKTNIVNISFSDNLLVSPLHWMISDKKESIVVEAMKDGLHIHKNKLGILTNNPPFEYHIANLNNYRNLSVSNGKNNFSNKINFDNYCQGLGAVGLPGDVSSMSRFVRIAFNKENSVCNDDELSSVSHFFHLLSSVEMTNGACKTPSGKYDITIYSSCVNTDKGLYYYKTYNNHQINCINMHNVDLNSKNIFHYKLVLSEQISFQN